MHYIFPQHNIQHTIIHILEVVLLMNWKMTSLSSQGMVKLFLAVILMAGLLINYIWFIESQLLLKCQMKLYLIDALPYWKQLHGRAK